MKKDTCQYSWETVLLLQHRCWQGRALMHVWAHTGVHTHLHVHTHMHMHARMHTRLHASEKQRLSFP